MKQLTLKEIATAVNGELDEKYKDLIVSNVSTDTREELNEKLFVAIRGEIFDGNAYIDTAFEKGAVCCITERSHNKPVIKVADTRKALIDLAEYYKSLFQIPVVAITGSAGKTTTKDMIASVLSQKYKVLKTEGNFNNEIGLPHTIFKLDDSIEVLVLEMGMNHFGEIHNLSYIAKPNIAVITNIGVSHIENLGSRGGILKAKLEILDYLAEDGLAVFNFEDDMLKQVNTNFNTMWYGKDVYATEIQENDITNTKCKIHYQDKSFYVTIAQAGHHMLLNTLAASGVAFTLGLSPTHVKQGIENFQPSKMRSNIITTAKFRIINDVYNANPNSVKAAIDVLKNAKRRQVCILGDMLELGEYTQEMHKEVGMYAKNAGIDLIIAVGKFSYYIYEGTNKCCEYFETQEVFIRNWKTLLKTGDTVLVKASRGMRFEKIVEEIMRCENE